MGLLRQSVFALVSAFAGMTIIKKLVHNIREHYPRCAAATSRNVYATASAKTQR